MICRFSPDAARREFTPVNNLFLAEYMPHADGVFVKIYLYGLMQCYHPSMCELSVSESLGVTDEQVLAAFTYWQSQGLVRISCERPLTVEYALTEQGEGAGVIPTKYYKLVQSLQSLTAPRQFGMRELKHVYDWIEVYGLEEATVLTLVAHCMELKGRRVSINYMSSVAQSWAEAGVTTIAAANAHIAAYELKNHGATEILQQWNRRRKPTVDEMAFYDKWTREWGFSRDAILAVLPRLTVSGTPNFVYLDEQLALLREQGKTALPEIRSDDRKGIQEKDFAKLLFSRMGKIEPATKTQRAQISMYLDEYQMPRELLLLAAEQARGGNEPFGLFKKILNDWHVKNVTTVADAEAAAAAAPARLAPSRKNPATAYQQHSYSEEELHKLYVNLDEDV